MSKFKDQLKYFLSGPRIELSNNFTKAAGVALLICGDPSSAEILFIKRSHNPKDSWSGQLAFPGGKMEKGDATLLDACLREVQEEVGLQLTTSMLVGTLDDLQASKKGTLTDFYIRPFVFYSEHKPEIVLCSNEVANTQWIAISFLCLESNRVQYLFEKEELPSSFPGIAFPGEDILWGLSYRITLNLLKKLNAC